MQILEDMLTYTRINASVKSAKSLENNSFVHLLLVSFVCLFIYLSVNEPTNSIRKITMHAIYCYPLPDKFPVEQYSHYNSTYRGVNEIATLFLYPCNLMSFM